jgi:hypothetical protein
MSTDSNAANSALSRPLVSCAKAWNLWLCWLQGASWLEGDDDLDRKRQLHPLNCRTLQIGWLKEMKKGSSTTRSVMPPPSQ